MRKRVLFSRKHQTLSDIAMHHNVVKDSLKHYFNSKTAPNYQFANYTSTKLNEELNCRLVELERNTIFNILSSLEAAFRIDYLQRCNKRKKDSLSRHFRTIYQEKETKASLENDILSIWKQEKPRSSRIIGELKGALKYRHWLAHGRYWTPKIEREYDYQSIYLLANAIFESFPFEGID